jgi:hypothetical protein
MDVTITIQWMDEYEPSTKQIILKNRVLAKIVGIQPIMSDESISLHYLSARQWTSPIRLSSSCEICTMIVAATRLSCKYESPNLSAWHQCCLHAISETNPHESMKYFYKGCTDFTERLIEQTGGSWCWGVWKEKTRDNPYSKQGRTPPCALSIFAVAEQGRTPLCALSIFRCRTPCAWWFCLWCVPTCGLLLETKILLPPPPLFMIREATLLGCLGDTIPLS